MKKLILIFILTFIAASIKIYANPSPPANGCWSIGCKGKIGWLFATANGDIHVLPPVGDKTLVQCTLAGGVYFTLKKSHINYKEIYAMFLTGIASKQDVYIRITQNTSNCEVNYVVIYPDKSSVEAKEEPNKDTYERNQN